MPPRKRLEWKPEALHELAESLAWYAERNPIAAGLVQVAIETAAESLVDPALSISGRPGRVPGTLEKVVGKSAPLYPGLSPQTGSA